MAELAIDADSVTVSLSAAEKVEAVHGDVTLARSAIVGVRSVADATTEIHGLHAPGTGIPGVVAVGTWREAGRRTFAACHGRGPAVVLELADAAFDRVVVTVEDPDRVVRALT